MKYVEFNENGLNDLDSIAKELFFSEDDPSSVNYKRCLTRPKINWIKIIIFSVIPFILVFVLNFLLCSFGINTEISFFICLAVFVVYCILLSKKAVICAVHIYQRFAPDSIRNNCRFEPSCSEYMIMAIEKYGLLKGLHKGIKRLRRCNVENGGYDYP